MGRTLHRHGARKMESFAFCLVQSALEDGKFATMDTIAATEFLPLVATAGAAADSVVVSLHDVAPCTQQITSTIISELGAPWRARLFSSCGAGLSS